MILTAVDPDSYIMHDKLLFVNTIVDTGSCLFRFLMPCRIYKY